MRVLAIDTSRGACSAAVYDGSLRYALARESLPMSRGHAEALGPMVDRVLKASDGGTAELTKVAVAVGPGSFTGLRIGVAMAKAIALTLEIPAVGVSTLIAYCGPMLDDPKHGVIAAVIDAGHGNVYFHLIDSKAKQIFSPRIVTLRDAVRAIGGSSARIVGDAASLLAEEARRAGVDVDASGASAYPDIVAIARIGLAADPAVWPARPLYIKPPDAHPPRDEAIARADS
ncbi:MAG: tRNA (adenosine(37)-N6)-threonylcarbamoyltransferase complex dimerization subunit type 1 TsaB [Pseudomonadota bacterium]|nr:tRNA (adenosine(37)-N6)-threonylcarbamoyltransferase complex dimerization subunit type 1 TsaB [Pseudomonadota bacterium]